MSIVPTSNNRQLAQFDEKALESFFTFLSESDGKMALEERETKIRLEKFLSAISGQFAMLSETNSKLKEFLILAESVEKEKETIHQSEVTALKGQIEISEKALQALRQNMLDEAKKIDDLVKKNHSLRDENLQTVKKHEGELLSKAQEREKAERNFQATIASKDQVLRETQVRDEARIAASVQERDNLDRNLRNQIAANTTNYERTIQNLNTQIAANAAASQNATAAVAQAHTTRVTDLNRTIESQNGEIARLIAVVHTRDITIQTVQNELNTSNSQLARANRLAEETRLQALDTYRLQPCCSNLSSCEERPGPFQRSTSKIPSFQALLDQRIERSRQPLNLDDNVRQQRSDNSILTEVLNSIHPSTARDFFGLRINEGPLTHWKNVLNAILTERTSRYR